ncbi:hypothetical protein KY495_23355 [Massilia sp. PAMC28688]|uniref:hypothetical protein n=1 Tax=Massilia sp. PAMC28688 TaxID=2861283 RepID=UPI001C63515A|nr:hypothetical protein [Massilia sp. PAMC28688]QYF93558.1 hypothetical protein KY495_23355 [Massilia sp. PAMC28688]
MKRAFSMVALALTLGGCASSAVVVGKVRPPIAASQVKLYVTPPKKFEEVALLQSSSQLSMAFTDQAKMDAVINRLKEEAGKVGANGVLLRGTGEQYGGSVGVGTGGGGFGLGTGIAITQKTGTGVAIFVTEE